MTQKEGKTQFIEEFVYLENNMQQKSPEISDGLPAAADAVFLFLTVFSASTTCLASMVESKS